MADLSLAVRPRRRFRWATLPTVIWAFLAISPVLLALYSSVKSNTQLIAEPLSWPRPWQWSNYRTAWNGPQFGQPAYRMVVNSLVATIVGIVLGLGAGTIAAYAVARSTGKIMGAVNRYFVLLITVPAVVTWIPLFSLADSWSMLSKPWALGIIYAAFTVPMAAVLMRSYFAGFPLDLIEAAKIDGTGEWGAFRRIVMPLSRGALVAVGLVQGISLWNELGLAAVLLLDPASQTLPIGLTLYQGQNVTDRADQFAALVLMAVPIVVLYLVFERRVTDGMRLGALK